MAVLIGFVIISVIVSAIALTVWVWLWMDQRYGGVRRWQLWLMSVVLCAIFGADLFLAPQPLDPRLVGLGAGLGALVGAIMGLFVKNPAPAPSQRKHR